LVNNSGLTLDGGSFTVLEKEAFAGSGLMDPVRPGERRLLSYAADVGLVASSRPETEKQTLTRLRASRGVIVQQSEARSTTVYTLRNNDAAPRTVILEHPYRIGWSLRSTPAPEETTPSSLRFRVLVPPGQTSSLKVEESRPVESRYVLTNLTGPQVDALVGQKALDAKTEEALRRILSQKSAVSELESQQSAFDDESEKIFNDQQRLRENMKSLKGSREERALLERYTGQLNSQEDRLEAIRAGSARLDKQIDEAKTALDRAIQEMSFDLNP
jgi:hypothetical protein